MVLATFSKIFSLQTSFSLDHKSRACGQNLYISFLYLTFYVTSMIFYLEELMARYDVLYKSGDPWFQEKLTISPEAMGKN